MIERGVGDVLRDRRTLLTAGVALVSGALSTTAFDKYSLWYLSPGVVFGVLMGILLIYLRLSNFTRASVFSVATLASWYAAFMLAIYVYGTIKRFIPADAGRMAVAGVVGGVLGAALLSAACSALFPWYRSWRRVGTAVLLCGVAGTLLGIDWGKGILLFTAWQVAFAGCLTWDVAARREALTETEKP